jgi:hypothetical protein
MFPDRPELHAMLARCYEEVGKKELAFHHRQLATRKKPAEQPRPQNAAEPPQLELPAEEEEAPADAAPL